MQNNLQLKLSENQLINNKYKFLVNTDLQYFELLKKEIQKKFLSNHSPSEEEISKWKGIDIIYFQEELRKYTKSNISEKTFYTYFKNNNDKVPRIDLLNLLSGYVGYLSWSDFKKNNKIIEEEVQIDDIPVIVTNDLPSLEIKDPTANAEVSEEIPNKYLPYNNTWAKVKKYSWLVISVVLLIAVLLISFSDKIFSKTFTYTFIDADLNKEVRNTLEIKVYKDNESPLQYKIEPGKKFIYTTRDKHLKMEISSPFYEGRVIERNLDNASEKEHIELRPDIYANMLYYYSYSIKDVKKKREQLDRLIDNNALIYQVYDSKDYGIETLNKQKYIGLMTTPTTSLKNYKMLETKINNGKIIMIKFKIEDNENK